jgi:hypothetical protein
MSVALLAALRAARTGLSGGANTMVSVEIQGAPEAVARALGFTNETRRQGIPT